MAVYDWPADLRPSAAKFYLEANTTLLTSPLSRASQRIIRQGARWRCELTYDHRNRVLAARLDAFLARLDGPGQEARLFDFRRPVPRGSAATGGDPVSTLFDDSTGFTDDTGFLDLMAVATADLAVAGALGDETIQTQGWARNQAVLLAGDYIGIGGTLFMALDDVLSDDAGRASITIRPRLRGALAAGSAITTDRPRARMLLEDNQQGVNATEPGGFSSYTISLIESLP